MPRKASSRSELLSWINTFLHTSYSKLEDASNGAVACQIIDAIHPGIVPMRHLDFSASTQYECQKNYQILNRIIIKLNLPFTINIMNLSKQGSKDSYEFMSMLKAYFDEHYNNEPYDAIQKRRSSKGSQKVTQINAHKYLIKEIDCHESVSSHYRERNQISDESEPMTSPSCTSPRSCIVTLDEYKRLQKELEEAKAKLNELESQNEKKGRMIGLFKKRESLLIRERSFYYDKLTTVERLLLNEPQLTDLDQSILSILYSRDGLDNDSVNSDDRASEGEVFSPNTDQRSDPI